MKMRFQRNSQTAYPQEKYMPNTLVVVQLCIVCTLAQIHSYAWNDNDIFIFHQDCNAPTTSQSLDRQPSDWLQSFKIPDHDTFSGSVQRAIDTGVISSKARREIVQVLRTLISMHTLYPVSEQYVAVSQKLVTKFLNLCDPIGTYGFVSVISDSSFLFHYL